MVRLDTDTEVQVSSDKYNALKTFYFQKINLIRNLKKLKELMTLTKKIVKSVNSMTK